MKKRVIIVGIVVLFMAGCLLAFLFYPAYDVQHFDLNDYDSELKAFTSDLVLGKVKDAEDAVKKARSAWYDIYGISSISYWSYEVFYDSQNDVWMICGSHLSTEGGVPYSILQGNTGAVLAVWHER